ncbi:MAG TPA: glycosyltransferase family 39 protein [Bacteroidales bacterium]|nr:glycosyltransferase family 39 protein [Bacteroidales bacterium]
MDKKAIKLFYILLILNMIIRFLIAFFTDLGIDEAYYFAYGLYWEWSYFDHPLMVGLLAKASAFVFGSSTALELRALTVIIGTANLLLVYQVAKTIKDRLTGFYAALLYSASFYGSVISGSFILPDNPLIFFWLLSILFIVKFLHSGKPALHYIFFFGVAAGLAFLSKYSALFLWFGMLCFAVKERKLQILKKPHIYISALISVLLFLPVILWNYNHAFTSFSFHSNRIGLENLSFKFDYFATELFGQIFYHNPVNIFIIISCFFYLFKHKKSFSEPTVTFLLFISLPVIVATLGISFFNRTLPHWSGPGYIGLIIFSAVVLRQKYSERIEKAVRPGLFSNIFFLIIIVFGLLQVNFGIINPDKATDEEKLGKNDISLDMYGWQQVKQKTTSLVNSDLLSKKIDSNFVFITHNWFPAGSIEFYVAHPLKRKLYVWGSKEKAHQYVTINKLRGGIDKNTDAYYITTSRHFGAPDDHLSDKFEITEPREVIEVTRNSKPVYNVFIYRLKNAKKNFTITNEPN